jgi:DNA-binding GntR family transcriptional regulator
VDRIAQRIQANILDGEYPLGAPLRQAALAKEFGVSRTPVREALRKLEPTGLVAVSPHQGAVVRGPTPRAIREAYLVRAELEGLAVELATPRMDKQSLVELRSAEQEFRSAVRALPRLGGGSEEGGFELADRAWVHANDMFHEVILRAAGNERLHRTITDLHLSFPRRLTWAALSERPELLGENIEEHRRVLRAIERQEPGSARIHMMYHVQRAGELVAQKFERDQNTQEGKVPENTNRRPQRQT